MKVIDKDNIEKSIDNYNKLFDAANDLLKWYHDNVKDIDGINRLSCEEIDIDEIQYGGWCPWEGGEYYNYSLPTQLLYDTPFREKTMLKAQQDKAQKEEQEKKEKEVEEKKKAEQKERYDREAYKRLKEKYELPEIK